LGGAEVSAIPPGYKQTEVGVIPEDWEVAQIRDVCRLVNGRGFKPFEWQTVGLPIIRIQNLNGSEDFNFYSGQYNPKILVEQGQLLFAWSGSRGTSFGPHVWNGGRALLNYHTWKVVVDEFTVTPDFLLYALRQLTAYIEDRAHGASALVHTQKWEMEKFPIVLPTSLPEQHAIAEALGEVDGLIESLEKLIFKKRDLKQGAMQQLLTGKKRLPGFSGKWEVKRLGNLLRFQVGFPFGSAYFNEKSDGVRLVKNRDLKSDDQIFHYSGKYEQAFVVRDGDVLVGMDGDFLPCKWSKDPALLNQRVGRIVPNSGLSVVFAYYALIEPLKEIETVTSSTTVKHLSHGDVEGIERPLPNLPEQTAIAEILSDMDAEIQGLETKLTKTRLLKQGMMQELLTGRIRLVESGEVEAAKKRKQP
jgi:type I restriction enzyme S subunit